MSQYITIGEATLVSDAGDFTAFWAVFTRMHHAAPHVREFNGVRGNQRNPSYDTWKAILCELDLTLLFEQDLMVNRPGIRPLTQRHADQIHAAVEAYLAKHKDPTNGPRWLDSASADKAAYAQEVALWLDWWVRWSINNCEKPAIYNHRMED